VTRLRARADAARAAAAGRSYLASQRYEILFTDASLITSGLARMAQFTHKQLSLTDCVSFELMDRFGLTTAFSFDRDFRDCGLPDAALAALPTWSCRPHGRRTTLDP
jgi:predicted nucleic acid-binding protein